MILSLETLEMELQDFLLQIPAFRQFLLFFKAPFKPRAQPEACKLPSTNNFYTSGTRKH